jgi:hypothetical protein
MNATNLQDNRLPKLDRATILLHSCQEDGSLFMMNVATVAAYKFYYL